MFDDLANSFQPFEIYFGPACAVCGIEVLPRKVSFVRGENVVCEYCVAEIRGQDPDRAEADSPRGS